MMTRPGDGKDNFHEYIPLPLFIDNFRGLLGKHDLWAEDEIRTNVSLS